MSPKESVKNERFIELVRGGVKSLGVRGFARAVDISPAIVTRYMGGTVGEPSQAMIQKLASFYKVPVAWLRGIMLCSYEKALELYLDDHKQVDGVESALAESDRAFKFAEAGSRYILENIALNKEIPGLVYGLDNDNLEKVKQYVLGLRGEVLHESEEKIVKQVKEDERLVAEQKRDPDFDKVAKQIKEHERRVAEQKQRDSDFDKMEENFVTITEIRHEGRTSKRSRSNRSE